MASIPGLRSPYDEVGGVVGFWRTLDKIRLHASGALPESYQGMLGMPNPFTMDGKSCRLFGVTYEDLTEETLTGASDDAILEWACQKGRRPSALEIEVSNAEALKQGWRDATTVYLQKTVADHGYPPELILTWGDFMDWDEGRPLRFGPDPKPGAGEIRPTALLPELRSPHEEVGGIVHFGRMLDKIRLQAKGGLPREWTAAKGIPASLDGITCQFLGVDYGELEERVLAGGDKDEELLAWACARGGQRSRKDFRIWNPYLSKRGWRDRFHERVEIRLRESGMPENAALTMFDFIDLDEGRPLRF